MKTSKSIQRWGILGIAVLLLAVLGILWGQRSEKDVSVDSAQRPAPDEPETALPKASFAELQWRVGSSQQYQVRFDSTMQMNAAGADGMQAIRVQMTCLMDLQTLEVSDQNALVGMRLSAVDLRVGGDTDPLTNEALTEPFRVRYAVGGFPEAFAFPVGVTAKHRSMLENLVRTFQVTMENEETWVAKESNASGAYEATYLRTAPLRVEKNKMHFIDLSSASMAAGDKITSTEDIQIDPQRDWIATMTVDEVLRTTGQGGLGMEITNRATLSLQSTAHPAPSETWRFVAAAAPPETEVIRPILQISPQEAHQQILAALPELDSATEGRITWIHRLGDLLRVDDSLPPMLLEEMKTQPFSDRTRADLYLAMELAGTESVQAVLVSVIEDTDWSTQDAIRAIVALAGVNRPSGETVAALWDTVESVPSNENRDQLVSTATLALGSLGNAMNAADDPDYPELRERLLVGARAVTESDSYTEQRTNYIHAMGNTGDASLAGDVVPFLDDETPSIRRAAALSLGRLGTNPVADELMTHLNHENSSQVRGAIAESLVNWTTPSASAMASIRDAVRTEPDEHTKYNMARFLGTNLEGFPENRAVLEDLMRTEPSKRIRRSVAETLATASK